MPRHARPRWGRIGAAAGAFLVTVVTLLAGVGLLPAASSAAANSHPRATLATDHVTPDPLVTDAVPTQAPSQRVGAETSTLPAGTGTGKRVVFDMSDQRVWLVDADGAVSRTYLVSGSLTDNLHPGTYAVYSTSRWATGIDDSGVMQYFVRFTRGAHAAIGFHSIPTKDGRPLQTRAQLGTPQSHGCIRQWLPDAEALWTFAPVGTKVVVTA